MTGNRTATGSGNRKPIHVRHALGDRRPARHVSS
jgi:hypothetical protein